MGNKPVAVDLCAGTGGWATGLKIAGWHVIGIDVENHGYEGDELVLQDVRTMSGVPMRERVSLIVASPPCQAYSYMAMPWKRAKAMAAEYRAHPERIPELNSIFHACERIAREAGCSIVIENVKGAQPWVGRAKAHFGSFYLWGSLESIGSRIVVGNVDMGMPTLRCPSGLERRTMVVHGLP